MLERSGLFVQRRLRDLVGICRNAGFDVVVDLPAFDVGLAKEAREALAEEGTMFFVTDVDVRSFNATLTHFKMLGGGPKLGIAINRIPDVMLMRVYPDSYLRRRLLVRVPQHQTVTTDTTHEKYRGRAGKGLVQTLRTLLSKIGNDDRRHLQGMR